MLNGHSFKMLGGLFEKLAQKGENWPNDILLGFCSVARLKFLYHCWKERYDVKQTARDI